MAAKDTNSKKQTLLLGAGILLLHLLLQYLPPAAPAYHRYLFLPLQYIRCLVTDVIGTDIGDILYVLAVLLLAVALIRWIIRLFHTRPFGAFFFRSLIKGCRWVLLVYLLLLLAWGGNYFRPSLSQQMVLPEATELLPADLLAFDSLLVSRLNSLAPGYKPLSTDAVNRNGRSGYRSLSGWYRVKAKHSLFGNAMAYMGIEGYFNPFTGEAQINGQLPDFMKPFVMLHEMAHQTGIAAEDDANLMAYIRCVQSGDTSILYSGYFNLWLYAHRQARMIDSSKARRIRENLNSLSLSHIDTLRAIRMRYSSSAEAYSSQIYDAYLKLGHQQMGIESYRNVAFTALCWERKYYKSVR